MWIIKTVPSVYTLLILTKKTVFMNHMIRLSHVSRFLPHYLISAPPLYLSSFDRQQGGGGDLSGLTTKKTFFYVCKQDLPCK